jgi:chromosome segregation ATPase
MTLASVNLVSGEGALLGTAGAIATAIVTWALTRWSRRAERRDDIAEMALTHSGTVATSEAAELWKVAKGLIDTLTERVSEGERRINTLAKQVESLLDANTGLLVKLEASGHLLDEVRQERLALQGEVDRLLAANQHLEERNAELEGLVTRLTALVQEHGIQNADTRGAA